MFFFMVLIASNGCFQETAHEKGQKYKEGKSVLERSVNARLKGFGYLFECTA